MIAKNFKIGDKVVLVNPDEHHVEEMDKWIGKEGTVTGYDDFGLTSVVFALNTNYVFDGTGLELVNPVPTHKFQIGDRVKVVAAKVDTPHQAFGYHMAMDKYEKEAKIFTISRQTASPDEGRFAYVFEEDRNFTWDERCLKRVRKAKISPVNDLIGAKPPMLQTGIIEAPVPVVEVPRAIRTAFQDGDRVICTHEQHARSLFHGKEYVINGSPYGKGEDVLVNIVGLDVGFFIDRFKHAIVYYENKTVIPVVPVIPAVIVPPKKPTLLEELRKKVGTDAGVCSYAIEFENGEFKMQVRDVCHARIPTYQREKQVVKLAIDIQGHLKGTRKDKLEPAYRKYVNYILNYSPWSPIFHKKGLDNAFKYGILIDVDKPLHQCQAAAVVLREGSEFSKKLPLFSELLQKGYSGNTSYLLSAAVSTRDGGYVFDGLSNAHKVLSGDQHAEKLFKFFREGYHAAKDDMPYRTHNYSSTGIYRYIAPATADIGDQINTIMKKEMKVVDIKGFYGASPKITSEDFFTYADVLETLLNKE